MFLNSTKQLHSQTSMYHVSIKKKELCAHSRVSSNVFGPPCKLWFFVIIYVYIYIEFDCLTRQTFVYMNRVSGGSCFRGPKIYDGPMSWMTTSTACLAHYLLFIYSQHDIIK